MSEIVIDFPAMDEASEAKMKKLIEDLADCFETTILIEPMTMMRVKYEGNKIEIDAILKRLAGNKTGLRIKSKVKSKSYSIKPLRPEETKLDKNIDPLGS